MPRKTTISLSVTIDENGKKETQAIMAEVVVNEDGSFQVGSNPEEGTRLRKQLFIALREAWPMHRSHFIFVRDAIESPVYWNTNTESSHLLLGDLAVTSNDITDNRRQRLDEAEKAQAAAAAPKS